MVFEKIGAEAVPVLLEGLADPNQKVRDHFGYALARMKPDSGAVPVLVKALGTERSRGIAVTTLANMGHKAKGAIPALEKLLSEEDLAFRTQVAWALWNIDDDDVKTVPILIDGLGQSDEWDRIRTIRWLAEIGAKAKPAIPALTKVLHDDSNLVRAEAAKALGQMGHQAKDATGALKQLLVDEDISVREKAAEALAHIEGKSEKSP
jgi:HEAT repeat protein